MRMTGDRASDFLTIGKGPDAIRAERIKREVEEGLARLDAALAEPLSLDERLVREHAAQGCQCRRCRAFRGED